MTRTFVVHEVAALDENNGGIGMNIESVSNVITHRSINNSEFDFVSKEPLRFLPIILQLSALRAPLE